jgi:zinc/manganese transport system permease protein
MISAEMIEITGPALVAGLMIALTHAPLGLEVLKRGIIFMDLAIAQIAGLGLVAAKTLMPEPAWWIPQGIALACALLAGLFFRLVERKAPGQQEALIGCSFVLAACLALLLLADHPHGGEEIQHLLSGQILFVAWADIVAHAPVYAGILALWFLTPALRKGLGFYLLFAIAITSSVQLAGIYIVFASLILPALAAVNSRNPLVPAWACGIVAVISGIFLSVILDAPAGPLLVIAYVCASALILGGRFIRIP